MSPSVFPFVVSSALFVAFPPVGGMRAPGDNHSFRGLGRTDSASSDVARLGAGEVGGVSLRKLSVLRALSTPMGVEILSFWVLPPFFPSLILLGGVLVATCPY